jgi:type IV secretion system protein TrbL
MCSKIEVRCNIREGFQTVVTSQFDALATKIGETASAGLQAIATFWVKTDSPALADPSAGWTETGPVAYLRDNVMMLTVPVFTLAIIVAGVRMAWEQRADPLQQLLKAIMVFVVIAGLGTATLHVLAEASDQFAMDVVENATSNQNQEFSQALGELVIKGGVDGAMMHGLPLMVAMFFGIAVFMASVVQVVLLLIRSAMLVLIAGTFPLAAAATNTEIGRAWLRKYCAWALAFIAYKPAAALVYAAAIRMNESGMTNTSGNGLVQALTGLMMLLLAVFALPALLRFVVPITAAVAGGHSGSGAAVADPGGLATGAINLGRSATGRMSAGGGGGGGGFGGGGSASSGSGGGATGALGVAASAGLAAVGGSISTAKRAGGALAGAAAHSAGESGGGSPGVSASQSNSPSWGARRTSSSARSTAAQERTPEPTGPTGSQ